MPLPQCQRVGVMGGGRIVGGGETSRFLDLESCMLVLVRPLQLGLEISQACVVPHVQQRPPSAPHCCPPRGPSPVYRPSSGPWHSMKSCDPSWQTSPLSGPG